MMNARLTSWPGAAVFLIALAVAVATARAQTDTAAPVVEIPARLDLRAIQLYSEKLDAYARLVAGSARLVTNAMRYMGSFNLKQGPTGKESSVYELVDIDGDLVAKVIKGGRDAAETEPAIPALDKAALGYADAIEAAPGVFNEAAGYYSSRQAYVADHLKRGKQLHPRIAAAITKLYGALPALIKSLRSARDQLDPQEIALLETTPGMEARHLARQLVQAGYAAGVFVPFSADARIDTAAFDTAIARYAEVASRYAAYRESKAGQADPALDGGSDAEVESLLRSLNDVRSDYGAGPIGHLALSLELLAFYGDFGGFWTAMLDIAEEKPLKAPLPAAPARPPVVAEIPDLDLTALAAWRDKTARTQRILVATNSLIDAWNRYGEWVDLDRGPTGKEKGIGGFADINRDSIVAAIKDSRLLAGSEPKIAGLDKLLEAYAGSIEKALPVAVEASGYYSRKDYLGDKLAGGKALHPRLMADYGDFLAARADLGEWVHQATVALDGRELVLIEKREGKSPDWHRLNIVSLARIAKESAPEKIDPSKEELKRFDDAIAAFVEAVGKVDSAGTGLGGLIERANSYVGTLRSLRGQYGNAGPAGTSLGVPTEFVSLATEFSILESIGRE